MAVRLFPQDFVQSELHKRGCSYVKEYGTAALWKTRRGVYFTVPQEGPDKRTDEYTLSRLLEEIEQYL
jgi:hypothetical protein